MAAQRSKAKLAKGAERASAHAGGGKREKQPAESKKERSPDSEDAELSAQAASVANLVKQQKEDGKGVEFKVEDGKAADEAADPDGLNKPLLKIRKMSGLTPPKPLQLAMTFGTMTTSSPNSSTQQAPTTNPSSLSPPPTGSSETPSSSPTHTSGGTSYPTHTSGGTPNPSQTSGGSPCPTQQSGGGSSYPTHQTGGGSSYPTQTTSGSSYPNQMNCGSSYPTQTSGGGPNTCPTSTGSTSYYGTNSYQTSPMSPTCGSFTTTDWSESYTTESSLESDGMPITNTVLVSLCMGAVVALIFLVNSARSQMDESDLAHATEDAQSVASILSLVTVVGIVIGLTMGLAKERYEKSQEHKYQTWIETGLKASFIIFGCLLQLLYYLKLKPKTKQPKPKSFSVGWNIFMFFGVGLVAMILAKLTLRMAMYGSPLLSLERTKRSWPVCCSYCTTSSLSQRPNSPIQSHFQLAGIFSCFLVLA
jgi:hypothetical protein